MINIITIGIFSLFQTGIITFLLIQINELKKNNDMLMCELIKIDNSDLNELIKKATKSL